MTVPDTTAAVPEPEQLGHAAALKYLEGWPAVPRRVVDLVRKTLACARRSPDGSHAHPLFMMVDGRRMRPREEEAWTEAWAALYEAHGPDVDAVEIQQAAAWNHAVTQLPEPVNHDVRHAIQRQSADASRWARAQYRREAYGQSGAEDQIDQATYWNPDNEITQWRLDNVEHGGRFLYAWGRAWPIRWVPDKAVGETWWVIAGSDLLTALERAAAGENPDIVIAELYANARRDTGEPS